MIMIIMHTMQARPANIYPEQPLIAKFRLLVYDSIAIFIAVIPLSAAIGASASRSR